MVTHRPATLSPVSHVAILNAGKLVDFGERDEVLQRQSQAQGHGQPQVSAEPAGLVQAKTKLQKAQL
jgi:ATP-binding cassette subfamily C protein